MKEREGDHLYRIELRTVRTAEDHAGDRYRLWEVHRIEDGQDELLSMFLGTREEARRVLTELMQQTTAAGDEILHVGEETRRFKR